MGNEFLFGIPEQDRPIVEKYIKDWDSKVTGKFQSLHKEYEPYKALGDLASVQKALQVNSYMQDDPIGFLNSFNRVIQQMKDEGILEMEDEPLEPENNNQQPPVVPNIDPRDAKIAELEKTIEAFGSKFSEFEKTTKAQSDMKALDEMMQKLHNEHGNFDDDYFLAQLQIGRSPEEAIKAWNNLVDGVVNSRQKRIPPTIPGGNGNLPGNQVDPSKLSAEERVKHIAATLQSIQS